MKIVAIFLAMLFSSVLVIENTAIAQEKDTKETSERKQRRKRRNQRRNSGLKVGQMAPVFKLKSLDGKSETDLKKFRGKKPVVLFFGSYT